MRILQLAGVALCVCALTVGAQGDIIWEWSFDTEAGAMVTDGTLVDGQAVVARYTILDFTVTESVSASQPGLGVPSLLGSLSSGFFQESQPTQGFDWDGEDVTTWWRSSGGYTNGSAFYHDAGVSYRYRFSPGDCAMDIVYGPTYAQSGLYMNPIPEPATFGLLAMCGVGFLRRRR